MCVRELDRSCECWCLRRPEDGGSPVLELPEVVSPLMWVLRTDQRSSARAESTLYQRAISSDSLMSCLAAEYSTLFCKQNRAKLQHMFRPSSRVPFKKAPWALKHHWFPFIESHLVTNHLWSLLVDLCFCVFSFYEKFSTEIDGR